MIFDKLKNHSPAPEVASSGLGTQDPMDILSAIPNKGPTSGNINVILQVQNMGANPHVFFGGNAATVLQVTPDGQLTVTLPKAASSFGFVEVKVTNDEGAVAKNSQIFSYYSSTIAFSEKQSIGVGLQPVNIISEDINGDQLADLVIANSSFGSTSSDPSLSILLGNGDGTFRSLPSIRLNVMPQYVSGLALSDLNHDGKLDLAFTVYDKSYTAKGKLGILLGNGDGTFQSTPADIIEVGINPYGLIYRDFDQDGQMEFIVVNLGPYTTPPAMPVPGSMPGMPLSFQTSGFTDVVVGTNPTSVVAMDINGDQLPDLATANYTSNDITVLLNKGGLQFEAPRSWKVSPTANVQAPYDLTAADINGDSKLDLLVANHLGQSIGYLQAVAGPDLFLPIQNFSTFSSPRAVVTGDFNGDKKVDIVVASDLENRLSVLLNNSF